MGKRYKNLFEKIINKDNLWLAYKKASKGKRSSFGYLVFKQNEATNIAKLHDGLKDGSYKVGIPKVFTVYEPKPRQIIAVPFVDRIVQHAICNIIDPIFEKTFVPQSYACRKNKGTHRAVVKTQSTIRHYPGTWFLKTDFRKYFASIDLEILHQEIRRKISCTKTLNLISLFIPKQGKGLPIGNLMSQLGANIFGNILDRWLIHSIKNIRFIRYMDDVVIFGHSKEYLALLQFLANNFAKQHMNLSFSHWTILPNVRGINFCGYRTFKAYKLLRKNSVIRAKRKLKRLTGEDRKRFIASWLGHASWANTFNLIKKLELVDE